MGSFSWLEQHRMVLSNFQGLVIRAGLPAPDTVLDSLCLVGCSTCDCLAFIELCPVLAGECAEAESRMAEGRKLEERVHTAEDDSEALYVTRVLVDKLKAERISVTAGPEHSKAECH